MFIVVEMKDCIRIAPHSFHKPLKKAITDELNHKLANKVSFEDTPDNQNT